MMENALSNIQIHIHVYSLSRIREFKKLRRLLQRKRHVNIELFVRLSVFTIIPCLSRYTKQVKCTSVCLVRMVFKFTWGQRMKNLLLRACVVVRTSNMKISRRPLADYVKNCTKKRAARAARLFFLIQPIKSLICDAVVVVAVVISWTPYLQEVVRETKVDISEHFFFSLLHTCTVSVVL